MLDNRPSVEMLLHAFRMFDEHGLIRDDLCFDPEHFMETVIIPHWDDCEEDGINAGDEDLIEFFSYEHQLKNTIATYIRTNTETGTKMAEVINENGEEVKAPIYNKIIRSESENEGVSVKVNNSIFWGPRETGQTVAKITSWCEIPGLKKEGYLVKHSKGIYGERFVEAKDIVFIS